MADCKTQRDDPPPHDAASFLYEAQYFGFTPQTCLSRVNATFQEALIEVLITLEEIIVRELKKTEPNEGQLRLRTRECTQKLQLFLQEHLENLTARMASLLIKPVFSIPPNVLLPEDQSHKDDPEALQVSPSLGGDQPEVQGLERELADLQRAYQAEVGAQQALYAELEEQRATQEQLEGMLRWIEELKADWRKQGMGGLTDSFQAVMESMDKLQDALGGTFEMSRGCEEGTTFE